MPNAQVFAAISGSGECLIISVNAAGAFTLTKGAKPSPQDGSVVPVTCDIIGNGTDYIIARSASDVHSPALRRRPSNDRSIVPIIGRAVGNISSININASTGAITAGANSTTVAALFT